MRWIPTPLDPAKPKLYLDLVPRTSWCSNLRSALPRADWDVLRKAAYKHANWNCLICGGRGPTHPLDAHERWHYADGVQKLIGIDGICPACHGVCHYGFSCTQDREYETFMHLRKVNRWSDDEAVAHVQQSFDEWDERSRQRWQLDVSLLKDMQVPLSPEGDEMLVHNGEFWTFADVLALSELKPKHQIPIKPSARKTQTKTSALPVAPRLV